MTNKYKVGDRVRVGECYGEISEIFNGRFSIKWDDGFTNFALLLGIISEIIPKQYKVGDRVLVEAVISGGLDHDNEYFVDFGSHRFDHEIYVKQEQVRDFAELEK